MHRYLVNQRALIDGKPGIAWAREHGEHGRYDCYLDGEQPTAAGEAPHRLYPAAQVQLLGRPGVVRNGDQLELAPVEHHPGVKR
jgi:hypothetical protein